MRLTERIRTYFLRALSVSGPKTATGGQGLAVVGLDYLRPQGHAMNVATVYRCVAKIAGAVANLPLQYQRLKGGVFVDDESNPLHYLLHVSPTAHMSAVDMMQQLVQHVLLRGNAYIVPTYGYDNGEYSLISLTLVDPTCVVHDTYADTYTVTDPINGVNGVYNERDIIHVKNISLDGKTGISTLAYARQTLDIAEVGGQETLNRFQNGGSVRGLLGNDNSVKGFGAYQDEQLKNLATDIDARFRAGARIVAVPGSAQLTPTTLSSADNEFLATRKFTVREICRFFGVHPSFVFDDTTSNYKDSQNANVAFLTDTLNPLLRKIENEFLRKLVPQSLCCKRRFVFDRTALYTCDLDGRAKYQAATLSSGVYTINDWRRLENKQVVEGGDKVLVSANLKTLDELVKQQTDEQD